MKKAFPIIILIAVLAYAGYYFMTKSKNANEHLFYGTVEATEVKLSAEVMGRVLEVTVGEGDTVDKDQVVIKIDHEALDAQLAQAEAGRTAASGQYAALGAQLKNIKTNYQRSENLLDAGSISEQKFDDVATAKKALQAQRTAAYGQIRQAEAMGEYIKTQIKRATVTSPMDGVVLARSVEPGEMVMPGSALLTIADLENCWVRIYVPETELGKVKLGQKVNIYSDSYPGKAYKGKVTMVASEAEFTPKNVQTKKERVRLVYGVKVSVPNPDGELKIGMPVDAELVE